MLIGHGWVQNYFEEIFCYGFYIIRPNPLILLKSQASNNKIIIIKK